MSERLVAYFSATGKTGKAAQRLAEAAGADLYEIKPEVPYEKKDLNWLNRKSRSSVEMKDKAHRPKIVAGDIDISKYDTVYLGFPIWWYVAPTIVNSFLESYDFTGKRIILFATSGSSKFGNALAELRPSAPDAEFSEGRVMSGVSTPEKLKELIDACLK